LLVSFPRYTKEQILEILTHRVEQVPSLIRVFDKASLLLISSKVGSHSGDARLALAICREVIQEKLVALTGENPKTNLVTVSDVSKLLTKYLGSPIVSVIQEFPMHHKVYLCSVISAHKKMKLPTLQSVSNTYTTQCKVLGFTPASGSEIKDMIDSFISSSIIQLKKGKTDNLRPVDLLISPEDIQFALKEIRFLQPLLT
jgi:Cdc6-like AAA superfamily ATPase